MDYILERNNGSIGLNADNMDNDGSGDDDYDALRDRARV